MIVISDTTPIISLIKIGHLDILQKLFGTVRIPKAFFAELTSPMMLYFRKMKPFGQLI